MKVGERIKALREKMGMKRTTLAQLIGVQPNTVYRYEAGIFNIKDSMKEKIAKALNTTVSSLIAGSSDTIFSIKDDRIDPDTLEIITPRKWVKVPLLDIGACAGYGWSPDFENVQIDSYENLPDFMVGAIDEERPPFMMRIAGDSMTDANLRDGDYAIVNPAEVVHSGDAALCQYGDFKDVAFKRVYYLPGGVLELRSANSEEDYPIIRYERDSDAWKYAPLTIIGKVMGFWGKPKRG